MNHPFLIAVQWGGLTSFQSKQIGNRNIHFQIQQANSGQIAITLFKIIIIIT